jgi:surface protein
MGIISASRLRASAIRPFIIEVDTTESGVSNSDQFQFTGARGNYDVVAKQGGVIVQIFNDLTGQETITFSNGSGVYVLEVTPKQNNAFNKIRFAFGGDRLKITDIKQWGTIVWYSMNRAFFGCFRLSVSATDSPDLSSCITLQQMFQDAGNANPATENWDVSNIRDFSSMFYDSGFNNIVNNWDVSNAADIRNMFIGTPFNQPLNNWDVSNVTDMTNMFNEASSFNQPLDNWDVSNVTSMTNMFNEASSFNQPLNSWDVSNVTNMRGMFREATSFNRDLSGWCVEQISSRPSVFDSGTSSWNLPNARPNWGATC